MDLQKLFRNSGFTGLLPIRLWINADTMDQSLKILHLEDISSDAELVDRALKKAGIIFEKRLVDTRQEYMKALEDFRPDIILSDHSLPTFNSLEALNLLKESGRNIPFILIT